MTHDELLAKIDTDQEITVYINAGLVNGEIPLKTGRQHWNQSNALRAVVELHKPEKVVTSGGTILEYQTSITVCSQCKRIAGYEIGYPCPTIQAIEKELK